MNHQPPPPVPPGTARALRSLSLLLLPIMASNGIGALHHFLLPEPMVGNRLDSTPYLKATGAPPLRFQESAAPSELATSPSVTTAIPNPAAIDLVEAVPAANVAEPLARVAPDEPIAADPALPSPRIPAAILPDDSRPTIRAEEFLPYFQVPGTGRRSSDMTVPVVSGTPATLPPSSATYTQTPK